MVALFEPPPIGGMQRSRGGIGSGGIEISSMALLVLVAGRRAHGRARLF